MEAGTEGLGPQLEPLREAIRAFYQSSGVPEAVLEARLSDAMLLVVGMADSEPDQLYPPQYCGLLSSQAQRVCNAVRNGQPLGPRQGLRQ